jgi:excisionase family DNA binding protein
MDNNKPLSAEQIIARITSDKALHDVLQSLLEEVRLLRSEIRQMQETRTLTAPAPYLTARDLAQMLQVSYETVRRRVAAGEWPALVIGRQARFGPEEIAAIRETLIKRSLEPPAGSWERRQRNKKIRELFPGGQ